MVTKMGAGMTRAIGYIRVSTDKQADQGVSLEAQQAKIKAYAQLYDLELVDIVVETGSAKSLEREGLLKVLGRLQAGDASALVVTKLDRLTRSVADLGKLVDDYFKDFALLSVSEQIDTRSAAGRLVLNVLASVSQWEREVIRERTSTAMQHMKKAGQYTGGQVPYGFRLEDGNLVKDLAEQRVLELVRKYRGQGLTLRTIANVLSEQGIRSRANRPFHFQAVARLAA
jgi:DNA invertase Pin-like site-specific DNA recombinase